MRSTLPLSLAFLLLTGALPALAQRGGVELPRPKKIDGDFVHKLLEPDAIPAIDQPRLATAEQAVAFMKDDEMVIGIVHQGVAKAYSTWFLDRHEIVNDTFAGGAIAVTW